MRLRPILAAAAALLCSALGATSFGADALPGVGVQPESYFYTGKPYDKDLEAYTFAFRNYDPHISRWTTADPSGFPDGANNFRYVAAPTLSLDPFGLDTVTYTKTMYWTQWYRLDAERPSGWAVSLQLISTVAGAPGGAEWASWLSLASGAAANSFGPTPASTTLLSALRFETDWRPENPHGKFVSLSVGVNSGETEFRAYHRNEQLNPNDDFFIPELELPLDFHPDQWAEASGGLPLPDSRGSYSSRVMSRWIQMNVSLTLE